MASVVEICNMALQKLGAKQITSLTEDTASARACNACYTVLRDAEFEKHKWNFSILRVSLAADSPAPTEGPSNSFTLPADFIKLADPDPWDNTFDIDYQIEGRKIFTNFDAPLYLRYVSRIEDPNTMTPLFREALACKMAFQMCEALTQSNSKKADARSDYKEAIMEARRSNGIARRPQESAEDPWITGRS